MEGTIGDVNLLVAYIYNKFIMAAGKYSFTIEQGSTLNFEIQYKDSGK